MNLENSIKDVIGEKIEDGTIEKGISSHFDKGVDAALSELFGPYGPLTKKIKNHLLSVLVPYLDAYDYKNYITKLDYVLNEILNETTFDHRKVLENFKDLMEPYEDKKEINLSEVFSEWGKYIAKTIDTSNLKVGYDDGISYYPINVSYEVDYNESRSWSELESAVIHFECEEDEEFNIALHIHRWKSIDKNLWTIDWDNKHSLSSLKHLSKFDIYMMKLKQAYTKINIDKDAMCDEVEIDAKPEAYFQ